MNIFQTEGEGTVVPTRRCKPTPSLFSFLSASRTRTKY